MIKVGVLGGTGYAGQELLRLLYHHKEVEIVKIISENNKEKKFSSVYRNFTGLQDHVCETINWNTIADNIEVLFSALPYGVLMEHLTKEILDQVKVIDIGVDYRLFHAEEYRKYYGSEHQSIELAKEFTYGLCEWNEKNIKKARHIANPGCYATAIELALLPLIQENVIHNHIIIDGKGAYSGAGKTITVGTHYVEANESVKPYRILNHPHGYESKKAIALFSGKETDLTFVPHMVPMQRGLLVTCYTTLQQPMNYDRIKDIYLKYYGNSSFVKLLDKGMYVETKWVKNSNLCHINFEVDEEENRLYVFAAIDNLIKGAAGQAIQNMNMMYELPDTMSLDYVPSFI